MPALYALGQHAALQEVSASLGEGEFVFAYLDDVYVLCDPERVAEVFLLVAAALRRHAGVEVNLGKSLIMHFGCIIWPWSLPRLTGKRRHK